MVCGILPTRKGRTKNKQSKKSEALFFIWFVYMVCLLANFAIPQRNILPYRVANFARPIARFSIHLSTGQRIAGTKKPPSTRLQPLRWLFELMTRIILQMSLNSQYELTNMILFAHTPDLKAPAKMVLTLLSGFGDAAGNNIYPSLKTIAKLSGMSTRSAQDNIAKLVELGYINKVSGGVIDGQNTNSQYSLNLDKLGLTKPENVVEVNFSKQEQAVTPDLRYMPDSVANRLKQN